MCLPFITSRNNCKRLRCKIPSRERRRRSRSRMKFITSRARIAFANRVCNTVKVHTRSISTKRANRPFRTHGLSGSTGLQDIAAETRKRVNASTLSLTSIRLVRHRINGMPQFPSTPRSCATPVRPCHFIWQDSNNRRSIIRGNRGLIRP